MKENPVITLRLLKLAATVKHYKFKKEKKRKKGPKRI